MVPAGRDDGFGPPKRPLVAVRPEVVNLVTEVLDIGVL
jgi:hypothetical protein